MYNIRLDDIDSDRPINIDGDTLSSIATSDSIMLIDPAAKEDGDGADNQSEVDIESNPLNPNSYPQTTVVELKQYFNLISIPADVTYRPQLRDWLPTIGSASEIDRVLAYDRSSQEFIQFDPESTNNPDFELSGGEGFIVYSNVDKSITFETVLCVPHDLQVGFNLVGFSCPPDNYTSFDLLTLIGAENVLSLQRYNFETGQFESAGLENENNIYGVNYRINRGEGYFLQMRANANGLEIP